MNHVRIAAAGSPSCLIGIVDSDPKRAADTAALYSCQVFPDCRSLTGQVDAAIVAVPTAAHASVACELLEAGVDVLVEKPISFNLVSADRMVAAAAANGRILQVGHLERFNPAVIALTGITRLPLFFEVHRMSLFSPRSLDIDVVLDLMIHDLDIVLSLVHAELEEIRAAGISILSPKVDIANVRLQFANGCVANLTASRASTETIRKMRVFQPAEYISVDYSRQELLAIHVTETREISFHPVEIRKDEPLRAQFESFIDCVRTRRKPEVDGADARRTLEVALAVVSKIEEHAAVVEATVSRQ